MYSKYICIYFGAFDFGSLDPAVTSYYHHLLWCDHRKCHRFGGHFLIIFGVDSPKKQVLHIFYLNYVRINTENPGL